MLTVPSLPEARQASVAFLSSFHRGRKGHFFVLEKVENGDKRRHKGLSLTTQKMLT